MHRAIIGVVVAASRPDRIRSVCENFERQDYPSRLLVLVLNGAARNERVELPPNAVALTSATGTPATPRNAGLRWLKVHTEHQLCCFWDDDDYYSPFYLTETVDRLLANRRGFTGKFMRYVRLEDRAVYYLLGKQESMLGGTLGGWVSDVPEFPEQPRDEDMLWCRAAVVQGLTPIELSGLHYMYNRQPGAHAWHTTKQQLLYSYGPAISLGQAPDEVVDAPPVGESLARPALEDVAAELAEQQLLRCMSEPIDAFGECP